VTAALLHREEVPIAELASVAALLGRSGLPTEDLAEYACRLWRFRDERGAVIGVAGLEVYGQDALLRSVAVVPAQRRRGIGAGIVRGTLEQAAASGARRVFLLTATAADFFTALGFTPIERALAPARIAATREFTTLCPASAACMMKALTPPQ
jgi:amino-acid N-acetyltransferase